MPRLTDRASGVRMLVEATEMGLIVVTVELVDRCA
jgi:hypothetical protein